MLALSVLWLEGDIIITTLFFKESLSETLSEYLYE